MSLGENLSKVNQKMAQAIQVAGRKPASVRLLAISKTQIVQKILTVYQEGQRLFGENYVQEALPKMAQLTSQNIEWHFVGSLQGKKVKSIIGKFALIHSVDRISLAEEISRRSIEKKCVQPVLLQVNIGDESTKGGVAAGDLLSLVESAVKLPGIRIDGLMTMPPLTATEAQARQNFRFTRDLLEKIKQNFSSHLSQHPFSELSMGTSADFTAAIAEGATLVRIGTDIFGSRTARKSGEEV
jgi:pyridoxal phosphate enzyme (YggS family)